MRVGLNAIDIFYKRFIKMINTNNFLSHVIMIIDIPTTIINITLPADTPVTL